MFLVLHSAFRLLVWLLLRLQSNSQDNRLLQKPPYDFHTEAFFCRFRRIQGRKKEKSFSGKHLKNPAKSVILVRLHGKWRHASGRLLVRASESQYGDVSKWSYRERLEIVLSRDGHVGSNPTISARNLASSRFSGCWFFCIYRDFLELCLRAVSLFFPRRTRYHLRVLSYFQP